MKANQIVIRSQDLLSLVAEKSAIAHSERAASIA
jgi:hypothetical protein